MAGVYLGNCVKEAVVSATLSPAAVSPNTSAEQTFTVSGLESGDYVMVNKPTTQAGLVVGNARVSAANTLAIAFGNLTATSITPTASEAYLVHVLRKDRTLTNAIF